MKQHKLLTIVTLFLVFTISIFSVADEGMYPLDSVDSWPVDDMKKNGLKIEFNELLNLKKAIAKVASGGSGSFVSEDGLLVTNHHVAYKCLAALDGTKKHKGVMNKGFVAHDKEQEISCPGYDLKVVEEVKDITSQVAAVLKPSLKGHKRFEAIRLAMEDLETECQKDGFFCEADALDGGRFYHMMVYRLIKDVRLVYAPEKDLGKFGGDVDNWRYPRHTADFTFLRAYVDTEGKSAGFSEANVPFKPLAHLKVSNDGVTKGDQVVVVGFPARTKRNYPAASAHYAVEVDMPARLSFYNGVLEVVNQISDKDDLSKRRYQGLDASLNNATKYYTDSLAQFKKWKIIEKSDARDNELLKKMKTDKKLKRQYGKVIPNINAIYNRFSKNYLKFFILQGLSRMVKSLGVSFDIAVCAQQGSKSDRMRDELKCKNKNKYKTVGMSDMLDGQITIKAEKALLYFIINEAQKLSGKQSIKAVKKFLTWGNKAKKQLKKEAKKAGKSYEDFYKELTNEDVSKDKVKTSVALMFAKTVIIAHDDSSSEMDRAKWQRRRLFYNGHKQAKKFKDPMLAFARDLSKELEVMKKGSYRALEETFNTELRPQYAKLIGASYPDANFQVRMSHGLVDDYTATKDSKTYKYITDLAGVIAKDKGEFPFHVPDGLTKAANADKGQFVDSNIGDVPVNFTCTLDTTGGNSGSGVLDSQGRLVGLLFDGTPESILSDWQFLPDDQRSIVMDIRYSLFLADKVHGAKELLQELGF